MYAIRSYYALIFTLMFIGGSSGSTGGGTKVIRVLLTVKNCYFELKRLIHPRAVIPMRINNKVVPHPLLNNLLALIVFYMRIFFIVTIIMAGLGLDVESAMGAVIATLGNIGPGIRITSYNVCYTKLLRYTVRSCRSSSRYRSSP